MAATATLLVAASGFAPNRGTHGRQVAARSGVLDKKELYAALARYRQHRALMRTSRAKLIRKRSRTAFAKDSAKEALLHAERAFPTIVQAPTKQQILPARGQRVRRYLGQHAALLDDAGSGSDSLVESTLPLRARDDAGKLSPVDLSLTRAGNELAAENSLTEVRAGETAGEGVALPGVGVRLRLVGGNADSRARVVAGKAFYPEVHRDTDQLVVVQPRGVETFNQLRSRASPETVAFRFALRPGARIIRVDREHSEPARDSWLEIRKGARRLGIIKPPTAFDADGEPVAVTYRAAGSTLTLHVKHRQRDVRYPILVDPSITCSSVCEDFPWKERGSDANYWIDFVGPDPNPWNDDEFERTFGTSNYGQGLYVRTKPYKYYHNLYYGGWTWFAPGDAFIYAADFLHVAHDPSANTVINEHIFGRTPELAGVWSGTYEEATWTQLDSPVPITGPSAWFGFTAVQDDNKRHCVRPDCTPGIRERPAGSPGNAATLGLGAVGDGYRGPLTSTAYMGGSRIYLHDFGRPGLYPPAHGGLPSGWIHSASPTVDAVARDHGLGIKRFTLSAPGLSQERVHSCRGDRNSPCPRDTDIALSSLGGAFSYSTASMPEGADTVSLQVKDVADNEADPGHSWLIKVDRSRPQLTPSGTLYDRRYDAASPGTYSLKIDGHDGSGQAPRSGVRQVSYKLKRGTTEVQSETVSNSNCNSITGCSYDFGHQFSIDTRNLPQATYTVEMTVEDQVSETDSANAASHRQTQSFDFTAGSAPPSGGRSAVICRFDASGPTSFVFTPLISLFPHGYDDFAAHYSWSGYAWCLPENTQRPFSMTGDETRQLDPSHGQRCYDGLTVPGKMTVGPADGFQLTDEPYELYLPGGGGVPDQTADIEFTRATGRGQGVVSFSQGDCGYYPAGWRIQGTFEVVNPHPTDTTKPVVDLSGSLKDNERKGLYDPAYTLHIDARDGTAEARQSGVESIDIFVDGQRQEPTVAKPCPEGNCSLSRDFAWASDTYTDGEHTIKVVVKDEAGNTTEKSWPVVNDRRGDIYQAKAYSGDPGVDGDEIASEWAQIGRHNARQETDEQITTRDSEACDASPVFGCGVVRGYSPPPEDEPSAAPAYTSFKGTSEDDSRLELVGDLLDPANRSLGPILDNGPINAALAPWQTPPPDHGSTYELYEVQDPGDADSTGPSKHRLWIDSKTKMPLRDSTVDDGALRDDVFYSYDKERRTAAEVPDDLFRVAAPGDTSATSEWDWGRNQLPAVPEPADEDEFTYATEFRQMFGLNSDAAYVQSLLQDPSRDPNTEKWGTPLTASELQDLDVRLSVAQAMRPIDNYGNGPAASEYAGTYLDQEHGGLVYVGFTANTAAHMSNLSSQFAYADRLRSFNATYTETQLYNTADQVSNDKTWLASQGVDVRSVSPSIQQNRVEVGVANASSATATVLSNRYGAIVLQVDEREGLTDADSKTGARVPPIYGGMGLFQSLTTQDPTCTQGFSAKRVVNRKRRYYGLTAGHCRQAGRVWYHGLKEVGHLESSQSRGDQAPGNVDIGYIRYKTRRFASPYVWGNSQRDLRPIGTYDLYPRSSDSSFPETHEGEHVCFSGWVRRSLRCGRVERASSENGGLHSLVRVKFAGKYGVCRGESGAPVFSGTSAVGIIKGFRKGSVFGSRDCGKTAYATQIQHALNRRNAALITVNTR